MFAGKELASFELNGIKMKIKPIVESNFFTIKLKTHYSSLLWKEQPPSDDLGIGSQITVLSFFLFLNDTLTKQ